MAPDSVIALRKHCEPTKATMRQDQRHGIVAYNLCEPAYVHAALGNNESMRTDFDEAIRLGRYFAERRATLSLVAPRTLRTHVSN